MRKISKYIRLLPVLVLLFILAGCGENEQNMEGKFQVYYVSTAETKVEMHPKDLQDGNLQEQLEEVLKLLAQTPDKLEYKAPLAMGFTLRDVKVEDQKAQLDMDEKYLELSPLTEVLVRAALVRTLCQFDDINLVSITVNGGQIYDSLGNPLSWMSADQFVDNDGNEINAYEYTRIMLYFANEEGTNLLAAYRDKHYLSNTPIERMAVEELMKGPSGQVGGLYPTINPATKILNVTTKDGICYVNLDSNFLTVVNNVPTEVSVYSIVNTLAELNSVNKVQILINGEVPAGFSASGYERNLDIVAAWER